jgi:hypothetical protein
MARNSTALIELETIYEHDRSFGVVRCRQIGREGQEVGRARHQSSRGSAHAQDSIRASIPSQLQRVSGAPGHSRAERRSEMLSMALIAIVVAAIMAIKVVAWFPPFHH